MPLDAHLLRVAARSEQVHRMTTDGRTRETIDARQFTLPVVVPSFRDQLLPFRWLVFQGMVAGPWSIIASRLLVTQIPPSVAT